MTTLQELEHRLTLTTTVARYEELRMRDSLVDHSDPESGADSIRPLSKEELLELLGLGEIIARKAG